jgi:hypothetical protein
MRGMISVGFSIGSKLEPDELLSPISFFLSEETLTDPPTDNAPGENFLYEEIGWGASRNTSSAIRKF